MSTAPEAGQHVLYYSALLPYPGTPACFKTCHAGRGIPRHVQRHYPKEPDARPAWGGGGNAGTVVHEEQRTWVSFEKSPSSSFPCIKDWSQKPFGEMGMEDY